MKKSKRASPTESYGKYVNELGRLKGDQSASIDFPMSTYGQDMIETTAIPITIALFTLYDIRYAVKMPPQRSPIQS